MLGVLVEYVSSLSIQVISYIPMRHGAYRSMSSSGESSDNGWEISIGIILIIVAITLYYRSKEIKPSRKMRDHREG